MKAGVEAPDDAPTQSRRVFLTCGSVDDGKSTPIGRLPHDTPSQIC
ncbi:hypothetical protein KCP73_17960 [Salmonella enterica subsp. enterica]|nr:hypothetical protein KCP73_17960 [Salmonella enterica subsp. enterica]